MNDWLLLWAYMNGLREGIYSAERLIARQSDVPLPREFAAQEPKAVENWPCVPRLRRNCAASRRLADRP